MSARKRDKDYISDIHIDSMFSSHDLMELDINCTYLPLSDVIETQDVYFIEMELPGVNKQDITVEVTENMITVMGQKIKLMEENEKRRYHCMGRSYGKFKRCFNLPGPFNMHNIKAKLEKGILTITVPKLTEKRSKKIIIPVE
ncbi:MAG: Hsp20/alpha crystallin family protein [Proteobacteria bacterium]|nr:Hsp20/alpha crystallin family protein [Pseudomonadota bacterium]